VFKGIISPLRGSEERWYSGYNPIIPSGLKEEWVIGFIEEI
jgi:hypothetical protein